MTQFLAYMLPTIADARVLPVEIAERTKVLVIDDDEAMTALMRLILEPNAFEVFTANSGQEGVDVARRNQPEAIIVDLMMPGMDGWEVTKHIRSFSQAPILVLSAMSKPGLVAQALDEGADDYLLKPMPSGLLIAHLRSLVRRAHAEKEARRQLDDGEKGLPPTPPRS